MTVTVKNERPGGRPFVAAGGEDLSRFPRSRNLFALAGEPLLLSFRDDLFNGVHTNLAKINKPSRCSWAKEDRPSARKKYSHLERDHSFAVRVVIAPSRDHFKPPCSRNRDAAKTTRAAS